MSNRSATIGGDLCTKCATRSSSAAIEQLNLAARMLANRSALIGGKRTIPMSSIMRFVYVIVSRTESPHKDVDCPFLIMPKHNFVSRRIFYFSSC